MAGMKKGGAGRLPVEQDGGKPQRPVIPTQTHGGFRSNIHHEAMEQLADERGMGREYLRQADGGYPEDLMSQGNSDVMGAVSPKGTEDYHTSKWSKK